MIKRSAKLTKTNAKPTKTKESAQTDRERASLEECDGFSALVATFALYGENQFGLIRSEFARTCKKQISDQTLRIFRRRYKNRIKKKIAREEIAGCPISRLEFRIKMIYRIYQDAAIVCTRGYETGKDGKRAKKVDDKKTMMQCLRLAHQMTMDLQKFELERDKRSVDANITGGTRPTENDEDDTLGDENIDDGVNFDDYEEIDQ